MNRCGMARVAGDALKRGAFPPLQLLMAIEVVYGAHAGAPERMRARKRHARGAWT